MDYVVLLIKVHTALKTVQFIKYYRLLRIMESTISKSNETPAMNTSTGFVGRMLQLPGIDSAVQQSQNVYGFIKGV